MNSLLNIFAGISRAGTLVSFLGMTTAVIIQVFARFLLPVAPNWTEEVARIFFIYTIAFGGGLAIRQDAFVKLDFLKYYLTTKTYAQLQLVVTLGIAAFSGLLIYQAWQFMLLGIPEKSPALLVSMVFVFFSLVLMMFSLFVFSLEKLLELLRPKTKLR